MPQQDYSAHKMTNIQVAYKNKLGEKLNANNIHLYWKGRVALYTLLQAMGIKAGDEVILPAFTCVVVPNAIIYLGAKPVYVDIKPDTFNMDVTQVEQAITSNTKVILCQNTYGLSSDLGQLVDIAKKHQLYTIEDCTHGFGGTYAGQANGTLCDAAFYSTQWNKPFSTGIGGFSLINNESLLDSVNDLHKQLTQASPKEQFSLRIQYLLKRYLINDFTYWQALNLYRFLSKHNIVTGSSSGEELSGIEMPTGFMKAFSDVQAKEGIKNIAQLDNAIATRKHNAQQYTDFLAKKNKNHVSKNLFENHSFLKYPLLVEDREQFFAKAAEHHIMLGDWFTSPIHPIETNWQNWHFDPKQYPVANMAAKKVVNLPTELNPQASERVFNFINRQLDLISSDE